MNGELDFDLGGFQPADTDSEQAEGILSAGDLKVLVEHHAPDRSHSYAIAHDESATWGVPGAPQLVAVKITRDVDQRTFNLECANHANLPFAQAWLIERGCPPEQIIVADGGFMWAAADDLTLRVEQKIRGAGQRYEVLDTETWDDDPCETWTLARDTLSAQDPIRVFLEQGNPEAFTYTVREGAFADEDTARDWLASRNSPLPQPPEDRGGSDGPRTRAALDRSAGTARATACGLDRRLLPSTATAQQRCQGRSL